MEKKNFLLKTIMTMIVNIRRPVNFKIIKARENVDNSSLISATMEASKKQHLRTEAKLYRQKADKC